MAQQPAERPEKMPDDRTLHQKALRGFGNTLSCSDEEQRSGRTIQRQGLGETENDGNQVGNAAKNL
jgi:hypothetical protein